MNEDKIVIERKVRRMRGFRNARGHIAQAAKSPMISVRFDSGIMELIRHMSHRADVPAAEIIRQLVQKGLSA